MPSFPIIQDCPSTTGAAPAHAYYDANSPDLLDRWSPVADWLWSEADAGRRVQPRVAAGLPGPVAAGFDASGKDLSGADFARRDHLNFSSHAQVIAAAKDALDRYGPHAAGPTALAGLTRLTVALETRIAEYLSLSQAVVFPDGWSAAMSAIRALVRPGDLVVLGPASPVGAREGAALAGAEVVALDATSPAQVEVVLARRRDPKSGVLVVADAQDDGRGAPTDLAALQAICNGHRATLIVDLTADLGLLGPTGRGRIEIEGMLGAVDVVIGSLAPVFASSAGFAASDHAAFRDALRHGGGPQAAAPALGPAETAAALAAFDLAESEAGAMARTQALGNANWLGAALRSKGFVVELSSGASVRVRLSHGALARRMTAAMQAAGAVVHLVGDEAGDGGYAWLFHVMADHTPADLSAAVAAAIKARQLAADPGWVPPVLCEA